jgi:cytochrome c5
MSEVHVGDHASLVHTPQQLVVVVALAFLVPILSIVMIVQMITGGMKVETDGALMSEESVVKRLKPVGEVAMVGDAPTIGMSAPSAPASTPGPTAAPSGKVDGSKVYQAVCVTCHGTGLLASPKFGDKAAWKPRIAAGLATLQEHAIKGIRTMPAKGGNSSLSDAEVGAAVDYMVGHSH